MGCFLCFERCSTVLNIIPGAYKCCAEPFHLVTFSGEIHRRPPVFHQIFWLQNRSSPFKDGNLHFFNYESKWDTKQKIPGCLTSRVHEILQKNITCNHFTKPKDIWVQSSFLVVAEIVTCLDVLFFWRHMQWSCSTSAARAGCWIGNLRSCNKIFCKIAIIFICIYIWVFPKIGVPPNHPS